MEAGHQIRRNLTGDRLEVLFPQGQDDSKSVSDSSKNARYLNSLLAQVRDLQLTEKPLFELVNFRIHEKGHNDRTRFERFFGFLGPDDETMRLLEGHGHEWCSQPLRFWEFSSAGRVDHNLRPEAQILGIFLRAERDGA